MHNPHMCNAGAKHQYNNTEAKDMYNPHLRNVEAKDMHNPHLRNVEAKDMCNNTVQPTHPCITGAKNLYNNTET
jgi:hypothetical protein